MSVELGQRLLPCLLTADMRRTLDFYIGVLGFTQTGYYPIESEPIRCDSGDPGTSSMATNDHGPSCPTSYT